MPTNDPPAEKTLLDPLPLPQVGVSVTIVPNTNPEATEPETTTVTVVINKAGYDVGAEEDAEAEPPT